MSELLLGMSKWHEYGYSLLFGGMVWTSTMGMILWSARCRKRVFMSKRAYGKQVAFAWWMRK